MTESDVMASIRLEGAKIGMRLWRNNVGVLTDMNGRPVRFGLANDSPEVNRRLKSSDLIGLWVGRFVSIECKESGWTYTGTAREIAQLRWIELIRQNNGLACFATGWQDVDSYIRSQGKHFTRGS